MTQTGGKGLDMRFLLTTGVTDLQSFLTDVSIKEMKSNVAMGEDRYNQSI